MIAEKFPHSLQPFFGKDLMQMAVGDDSMPPFSSDGVHGKIAGQDTHENDDQCGIGMDETKIDKKTAG
jgi:hypothetical protein